MIYQRLVPTLMLATASLVQAVTITQVDTFANGSTMGWHVGGAAAAPFLPTVIIGGGPMGASDNYLQLKASGQGGPSGKLSALSGPQWAGNYLTSGITGIQMDVRNFGPDDLYLRLLFEDEQQMGPPANLALSADAVFVPAGADWRTILFPITPDALVPGIFGNVNDALANTDLIRLFHNPSATFPGPPSGIPAVNVTLGVDNIAVVVPEPATAWFVALGAAAFGYARKRRRTQN